MFAVNSRPRTKPRSGLIFGNGPARPGWTRVAPTNFYPAQAAYGFEPGTAVVAGAGCVTGTNPFYFSVRLPEGNYRVTALLGGSAGESIVTVKAELRRLDARKNPRPARKTGDAFVHRECADARKFPATATKCI